MASDICLHSECRRCVLVQCKYYSALKFLTVSSFNAFADRRLFSRFKILLSIILDILSMHHD